MPAKPRVNETNFHVLKRSVPNETSCPSLASDVSSKGSDSIEPSNAEHERRVTIALKPGGLLDIDRPDRLIIWSRWLEDEPNPVYGHGAVERRRHWNDLFGALSLQCEKFEVEYMKDSGRVDGPSPQAINGDEPVDGGVRKRGIGTGQIPTNVRNTSEIRSPKNRLSDDIISPKGSDKARLLLGFGVFDAWEEEWDFMCYLFKRHPTEHEECAGFHVQEERSVRTVSPLPASRDQTACANILPRTTLGGIRSAATSHRKHMSTLSIWRGTLAQSSRIFTAVKRE